MYRFGKCVVYFKFAVYCLSLAFLILVLCNSCVAVSVSAEENPKDNYNTELFFQKPADIAMDTVDTNDSNRSAIYIAVCFIIAGVIGGAVLKKGYVNKDE